MKLHAFETGTDPRLRAYTRDRGGKRLKRPFSLPSLGIEIDPKGWRYVGEDSTTGYPLEHVQPLHAQIKRYGFAVTRMPPLLTRFHVFDLQLDIANLRIYSHDPELQAFNLFRKRLELSPNGDCFSGGDPMHRGELEIPSEASATALGLNYHKLQNHGFELVVPSTPRWEEAIRRRLQRELKEHFRSKLQKFGCDLVNIRVDSVTFRPHSADNKAPTIPEHKPAASGSGINISINNRNVIQPIAPVPTSTGIHQNPRIFDGWISRLLGVLAALATIGMCLWSLRAA